MSKIIRTNELIALLDSIDKAGHRFAGLSLCTSPNLTKKHRETSLSFKETFGADRIEKTTEGTYHIGGSYENMVNNTLDRKDYEKNFVADSLPWGEWMPGSKVLLIHKGEVYVRAYPTSKLTSQHFLVHQMDDSVVTTEMTPAQFANAKVGFMDKEREVKALASGSFDEAKPAVNSIKITNIKALRYADTEYLVVH